MGIREVVEGSEADAEPIEAAKIIKIVKTKIILQIKIKLLTNKSLIKRVLVMLMGPQIAHALAIGPQDGVRLTAPTLSIVAGPTSLLLDLKITKIDKLAALV